MISVVVPIFNEEDLIDVLISRLSDSLIKITDDFEVVFVDDGSSDNSLQKLIEYQKTDSRFKILVLSRNFGPYSACTAGLNYAKGEYVALIDGDLQDPPELIQDMYKKLRDEDYDLVCAERTKRSESFFKRKMTNLFYYIFNNFGNTPIRVNAGNFSMMNRKCLDELLKLKEKSRYLPGLRSYIGFKQVNISYDRDKRYAGEAKMTYSKLFKIGLDAVFSFSNFPIKLCTFLGAVGIVLSLLLMTYTLISKLMGIAPLGWTSVIISIYFIGSMQLFFLGIIGEYINRIFLEIQNRPLFIVDQYICKVYD